MANDLSEPITRKEALLNAIEKNTRGAEEETQLPEPVTREEMYLSAIAQNTAGGGGGGGGGAEPFVITCTPTMPNYSGTMDKTPAEILEAYLAGRRIQVSVPAMNAKADATMYAELDLNEDGTIDAVEVSAIVLIKNNGFTALLHAATDATTQVYNTAIYALTPLGS